MIWDWVHLKAQVYIRVCESESLGPLTGNVTHSIIHVLTPSIKRYILLSSYKIPSPVLSSNINWPTLYTVTPSNQEARELIDDGGAQADMQASIAPFL